MSNQNKQNDPNTRLNLNKNVAALVNEKSYAHKQATDNPGISLSAIGRWVGAEKGPVTPLATRKAF